MTLAEIAAELRKLYPAAVSVEVAVSSDEYAVELKYVDNRDPVYGASYKRLDGQWVQGHAAGHSHRTRENMPVKD